MKRENLFASLAAFASIAGLSQACLAQLCDTASQAGDFVSTDGWSRVYDADSDYDDCPDSFANPDDGIDLNGGCNESAPLFDYLGVIAPGSSVRYRGATGCYYQTPECGDNPAQGLYRDIDWIQFSVSEPCYVSLSLALKDKNGDPVDLDADPATGGYMFFATGPETTSGTVYCADEGGYTGIYSEFGSCPQVPFVTLPNGIQKTDMPVPAGRHMIVLTVDDFNFTLYGGECEYVLTVNVTPLTNESCGTSTESCTEAHATPGCNDPLCCETVCNISPACCETEWDQNCIGTGVDECGLFIYECVTNASAPNDCAGQAEFIDASLLPITFGFDASEATNDGPNNVNELCSSNTTRDVWYVVGPLPYDGELRASMCELGNTGDAVLSMYALGIDPDTGTPISSLADGSTLPNLYIGCRDDVCDDDGDGQLDTGGPAGINMLGVSKDEYYLIRIGTFLDVGQNPDDPSIAGLVGSVRVSFKANVFSNGWTLADSAGDPLLFVSGYSTAASPKRWMFTPFSTTQAATISSFDFASWPGNNQECDTVNWLIVSRDSSAPDHGAFGRPFGDGNFSASAILFEGSAAFDWEQYALLLDEMAARYFIDVPTPFLLDAGDYYFTLYGSDSSGTIPDAGFVWSGISTNGVPNQVLTTLDNTGIGLDPTGNDARVNGPFGWRSSGPGPAVNVYSLKGINDTVPAGLTDPSFMYQCGFSLKGDLANPCFGDIDGSGEVDNGDVAFALLDYGPCPGCSTDLDGTGEVDFGDVALILLSTGPCF